MEHEEVIKSGPAPTSRISLYPRLCVVQSRNLNMFFPTLLPLVLVLHIPFSAAQDTTSEDTPSLTGSATVPTGSECQP